MFARITLAAACLGALGYAATAANQDAKGAKPAKDAKAPAGPNGRYDIDPDHTEVIFKISHVGVSNFYGRFNKTGGKLLIDAENAAESVINFSIETGSIDTNHEGRDKHLRGPDFFNAEEFPAIEFESETVKALDATHFEIGGKLTLHGVEKAITVKAEQTGFASNAMMGTRVGYEARFTIKRSDFGMDYQPGALGEEVDVILSLEGVKSK